VVAVLARAETDHVRFLTFDYGQSNRVELSRARAIAAAAAPGAPHDVVRLDLSVLARSKRSALLGGGTAAGASYRHYVPGRNMIFLALAAAVAEVEDLGRIYVGSNLQDAVRPDGSGYPDSGLPFLKAAAAAVNRGLKFGGPIEIRAPLVSTNKFEAIRFAHDRGFDLSLTWSCYEDGPTACGECGACRARLTNFHWAGLADPVPYRVPQSEALAKALTT
jgi:7-cyano-7-deazaguanine synthase